MTRPAGEPARELGACLQQRVRRRLGDQSGAERTAPRTTQEHRQRHRRNGIRVDDAQQSIDRRDGILAHDVEVQRRVQRGVPVTDHDARKRRQPLDRSRMRSRSIRRRDDDHESIGADELVDRERRAEQRIELTVGERHDVDASTVASRRSPAASMDDVDERVAAWAASGAMALTGRADRPPLGPPATLVERLEPIGLALRVDPLRLLTERAALMGLTRNGDISCGGATRLVRAADGWLAVSLSRDDDVDAVPAWLELDGATSDVWTAVATAVA